MSIHQAEGLKVYGTQGLTQQSCKTFYNILQLLYSRKNNLANHIWNSDEIGIQVGKLARARMWTNYDSQKFYNTIPKSKQCLIVNCVINALGKFLLTFYIFKGEKL